MSLKVLYSFDHVTTADILSLPGVIGAGTGCSISTFEGRGLGGCLVTTSILNLGANPGFRFAVDTPYHDITFGAWVVIEDTPAANGILLGYGNPAAALTSVSDRLITVVAASDGSIRILGAEAALLATSAPGVLTYGPGQAHYIEVRVIITSAGLIQVKVDGNFVINMAPVNTQFFDAILVTHIMLGNPVGSTRTKFDDIYVTSGEVNGDGWVSIKGVTQIDGKLVNAAGEVTQWNPSTPTGVNFSNVFDPTPDQTTFNSAGTIGLIDLYNVEDVTYAPTAVQLDLYMRKTGVGPSSVSPVLRPNPGGANSVGPVIPLSTQFKYYRQTYPLNPNGSIAWTMAAYNQLQVGVSKVE